MMPRVFFLSDAKMPDKQRTMRGRKDLQNWVILHKDHGEDRWRPSAPFNYATAIWLYVSWCMDWRADIHIRLIAPGGIIAAERNDSTSWDPRDPKHGSLLMGIGDYRPNYRDLVDTAQIRPSITAPKYVTDHPGYPFLSIPASKTRK